MRKSLAPLLITVLVMYSAQQLLTPILAPLSRELALTETQLGLVITIAAAALTVSSPLWGRALDTIGLRRVLLAGLALCTTGLAGFAVVSSLGLDETLTPGPTFTLMLVFRSLIFGAGLAALPVAALAVAGTATTDEAERTRAVGLVGAAQGLSIVIGPAAGGVLAVFSLLLPLYLAPAIAAVLALWVGIGVKPAAVERPQQTVRSRPWELWPVFGVGFLMYLSLGLVQVIVGFLVADRLHLDSRATAGTVGVVLFVAGIGLVATQGALVPKLKWPAARLMRVGAPIALAGYGILTFASTTWLMAAAFLVTSVGLGLAVAGFAAAASLGVGREHQGSIAGLVNATTGLTFILGPLLSTALYEVEPVVPVIAAAVAAALAFVLSLRKPRSADLTLVERPA
ncbi:MFS transporter [Lentzea flava]|uniref:MFS transporter n=1 Tax=Lentzea flava TaxID=103732 RepID=A0ABQ2UCS2_9PSEU|nr:MFS transporter [Lentzea flava]MCP2197849.1 putative arabinose efflux permease, MFS family [Lentzea flava]GGU22898.1 MFS transporter [Lentzea flava]